MLYYIQVGKDIRRTTRQEALERGWQVKYVDDGVIVYQPIVDTYTANNGAHVCVVGV